MSWLSSHRERSERTKQGLQAARARGVTLGRPRTLPEQTIARIRELRDTNLSYAAIARTLEAEQVPTAQGGRWHPTTVRKILNRQEP